MPGAARTLLARTSASGKWRFLSAGGSDYPLEILKIAGIDLKQAISECMAEFGAAVSELEELLLG